RRQRQRLSGVRVYRRDEDLVLPLDDQRLVDGPHLDEAGDARSVHALAPEARARPPAGYLAMDARARRLKVSGHQQITTGPDRLRLRRSTNRLPYSVERRDSASGS